MNQKSNSKKRMRKMITRKELSNICCLHHDLSYKIQWCILWTN